MQVLLISLIIFFAVFVQAVSGFGVALLAMPLLTSVIGIGMTAPLVALIALVAKIVILLRYRESFQFRTVARLTVASVVGIPLGIALFKWMDEQTMLFVLGVIICAYALYALLRLKMPALHHILWEYVLGFISGVLAGAYNVPGPPVAIYGDARGWQPDEFRSNMQGMAMVSSVMVIALHMGSGSFTAPVMSTFLLAIPATALGLAAGFMANHRLDPARFRTIVLVVLLFTGLQLIF